jgi:hypothetical protein
MGNDVEQTYIYFLQLTARLPMGYFTMAEGLSKLGITLLAITPKEFLNIQDGKRRFVMAFCNDMASQQAFLDCKKRFLDFGLSSGNLVLMHISSFGPAESAAKQSARRPGTFYHHFALPMDVLKACKQAALVYYREKAERQGWPGGKRPKLSFDLTKNQ